jgi:hypothetical protein
MYRYRMQAQEKDTVSMVLHPKITVKDLIIVPVFSLLECMSLKDFRP